MIYFSKALIALVATTYMHSITAMPTKRQTCGINTYPCHFQIDIGQCKLGELNDGQVRVSETGFSQIDDGQVRVCALEGTNLENNGPGSTFELRDGQIVDQDGRQCEISNQNQFQCSNPPTIGSTITGFSVCNGQLAYQGSTDFLACLATGEFPGYNIYSSNVDRSTVTQCTAVKLNVPDCAVPPVPLPSPIPVEHAACPSTAHEDFLGSKNYPRIILPVSTQNQHEVGAIDYFPVISPTKSTIFTFDYQRVGTCTLHFKFPTKAQIVALQGTTDYTFSGSGRIRVYELASQVEQNISFEQKPARTGQVWEATLVEGGETNIATFQCPAGRSVSYEVESVDGTDFRFFLDYNPPVLAFMKLEC